jgi:HK97 family phage prohead protease
MTIIERSYAQGVSLRADGEGRTLTGHFAVFDTWTTIDSWEGRFLERLAPGSLSRTLVEDRARMRVLLEHGRDPQVGNKPLGSIRSLFEDTIGAFYEVDLLDTQYVRELIPGLLAGVFGASFRFSVTEAGEAWDHHPTRSAHNPEAIPERTITQAKVFEFGPVTFGAYVQATAGVRSLDPRSPARLRELIAAHS